MKASKLICSLLLTALTASMPAMAQTAPSNGSDKMDLKKLEDKYWSSKDDYGVIQNRTFSKTGKFYLSAVYGPLMNDPYAKGRAAGGMLGYFINEDFGVEASFLSYSTSNNDTTSEVLTLGGAPSYNFIKANKSLSLTYTPFYAKMAFMNKAIMYFDMGFTLGGGMTDYEIQKVDVGGARANEMKSAPHVEVGLMQQLFLGEHFAFRLDVKNTFSNQTIQKFKPSGSGERIESTKNINDTTITLGLTVFTK